MKHNHWNNKQALGSRGFCDKMAPILKGGLDQNCQELELIILVNKIQNLPNSVLVLLIFQKSEI